MKVQNQRVGSFFTAAPVTKEFNRRTWTRIEHQPYVKGPNPILDSGCPRNVGDIDCAMEMCNALSIPFDLEPLNRDPFYHGYGMNCSAAKLTIGMWKLPLVYVHGNCFEVRFYRR